MLQLLFWLTTALLMQRLQVGNGTASYPVAALVQLIVWWVRILLAALSCARRQCRYSIETYYFPAQRSNAIRLIGRAAGILIRCAWVRFPLALLKILRRVGTMELQFKELLLFYITLSGFVSYVPQIVRICTRKSSEDVSISSWTLWTLNSIIYLAYLLLSSENIWLLMSQLLEVLLISTTLFSIIITRKSKKAK